jgi:hypothetical protein
LLPLAVDENFNNRILRALLRQRPDLDIVRAQDAGLSGVDDTAILDWAARENRVLLTHDVTTITKHAFVRTRNGDAMPGVFEVPPLAPLGAVVADILLLCECSLPGEWEGQVRYLPLR